MYNLKDVIKVLVAASSTWRGNTMNKIIRDNIKVKPDVIFSVLAANFDDFLNSNKEVLEYLSSEVQNQFSPAGVISLLAKIEIADDRLYNYGLNQLWDRLLIGFSDSPDNFYTYVATDTEKIPVYFTKDLLRRTRTELLRHFEPGFNRSFLSFVEWFSSVRFKKCRELANLVKSLSSYFDASTNRYFNMQLVSAILPHFEYLSKKEKQAIRGKIVSSIDNFDDPIKSIFKKPLLYKFNDDNIAKALLRNSVKHQLNEYTEGIIQYADNGDISIDYLFYVFELNVDDGIHKYSRLRAALTSEDKKKVLLKIHKFAITEQISSNRLDDLLDKEGEAGFFIKPLSS